MPEPSKNSTVDAERLPLSARGRIASLRLKTAREHYNLFIVIVLQVSVSVSRQEGVLKNVVADCGAEHSAIVAGGAEVDSAEDTGVGDLIKRIIETGERPCHSGHLVRSDNEGRVGAEELRKYSRCRAR